MECTGQLQGISKDWQTDKFIVSIAINEKISQETIEEIQNCKLSVVLKKYRQKRSLDANAYCWVLLSKIADKVKTSKEEIYEAMLQDYGVLYQDENGDYITITLKSNVDITKVAGHWKRYKSNGEFTAYLMIKGTSEYDTSEMAHFIDMVVHEAKEMGIETLPPDELERMCAMWGVKNG